MMVIKIRRARKGDTSGVARFVNVDIKKGEWVYTGRGDVWGKKKIAEVGESYSGKNNSYSFVAVDSDESRVVGSVNFSFKKGGRTRHRVNFGWCVNSDCAGRGVGTRLLRVALKFAKEKGFKRAEAEAAVKNIGSVKLTKKCGFKIEGIKKRGLVLDSGRYVDTYIFGRLL